MPDVSFFGTDLEFAVKCAPGTSSYISRKRNIISLYDKAVHGRNLAKQKNVDENHHKCSFSGTLDSQRHLLLECKDPDLILMRERTFDTFHRELDSVLHHQDKWHSIFYSLARLAWSLDTPDLERFWLGTYNHQTWSRLCGDEDHHILHSTREKHELLSCIQTLTRPLRKFVEEAISSQCVQGSAASHHLISSVSPSSITLCSLFSDFQ